LPDPLVLKLIMWVYAVHNYDMLGNRSTN